MLETIFNQMVLDENKFWPPVLMPEIASLIVNLTSCDSYQVLDRLIRIRTPTVLFKLMASTYPKSISTTTFCLDALCNLVECFQEPDLYERVLD